MMRTDNKRQKFSLFPQIEKYERKIITSDYLLSWAPAKRGGNEASINGNGAKLEKKGDFEKNSFHLKKNCFAQTRKKRAEYA
jgi:hypothetical protein